MNKLGMFKPGVTLLIVAAIASLVLGGVNLMTEGRIETLAEGMETPRQKQFLRQIDCELAQGFLFYKPQPVEAVKYRLQHGGAAIPCETPEERREYSLAWMKALEGNG